MRTVSGIAAAALLLVPAVDAAAQVIQRPPRSTERPRTTGGLFGGQAPSDPNRTSQELTLTLDFLAGYEDSLSPDGGQATPDPTAPTVAGATGVFGGRLSYRRGRLARGIEANARSVVAGYQNVGVRPMVGGLASLRGFTEIFDSLTVNSWGEVDYRPTFMFTSSIPSSADAVPAADPTGGVAEIRSVNASGGLSLSQAWTTRQSTSATYSYTRTRSTGIGEMDVQDHSGTVGHTWNLFRNVGLQGSASTSRQSAGNEAVGSRPLETQTGTFGVEVRVPISRTRRMTLSGSGGATRVNTYSAVDDTPIDYLTPSGGASIRLDVGRTWALSADASRTVTMLEGLSLQSFVTTAVTLWTGGRLGERALLSVTGSYSDGAPHEGDLGSFSATGGTAQLQLDLSRCCSLLTSYSYYEHRLRDVTAVPTGFPSTFERNTARVGMTVWLPLYGTFPAGRRR